MGGRPRASSVRADFLPTYGRDRTTSGMSLSSPRSVGSGEDGMGFSRVSMLVGLVGRVEGGEGGVVFLFFLWGGMGFLQNREKLSIQVNVFQNTSLRFFVDKMVRDGDGRACRITCGEEKETRKQTK